MKKNQPVKFRTRADRPEMSGKYLGESPSTKGLFIRVKADDGRELKVRPVNVSPA